MVPFSENSFEVCLAPAAVETKNLLLVKVDRSHLGDLVALYSDPDLMKFVCWGPVFSKAETEFWLEEKMKYWIMHGYGPYAFLDRKTKEFVGRGRLSTWDDSGRVEIGFAIRKHYRGRGLATEAGQMLINIGFKFLGLESIFSTLRKNNFASKKTVEKIWMSCVGEEL